MKEFQIAGGSVPGTDHTMPGQCGWKNNQDAYVWQLLPDRIFAVVCDGCSSAEYSEVGARQGSYIVTSAMDFVLATMGRATLTSMTGVGAFCRELMNNVLNRISIIAGKVGGTYEDILQTQFLFSVMGLVMTPEVTLIISCGDGVYAVNGEVSTIGPYPGNAPPYLAYRLLSNRTIEFTPHVLCPTADVQSVFIGTDGVTYLQQASEALIPSTKFGTTEPIGDLNQFWENDMFYENTDGIRRRLALINLERVVNGRIKRGPLRDDITLVTVRRMP
jgi:hypothetical protein